MDKNKATTVDEYIANAPKELHAKLNAIRSAIKEVAPNATEKISYQIPYYNYKGHLVYFGYNKAHIGIYAITKAVFKQYEKEVKPYMAAKGTVRIPFDQDVPIDLIKKLVKAQVKANDEEKANK